MADEHTRLGSISLAPRAVATIASQTALQSYGVVGMASKSFADRLAHLFAKDPRHGVEIQFQGEGLAIELYVVLEYGSPIATVAENLTEAVRFQVERILGLEVTAIHVHVQALHMSPGT